MADQPDRARWLLLIHQLPKEPAYVRVKVGRRIARVGAIALKSSVYVLPQTDSATEDFQWVRREVREAGGDATVVEAQLIEGLSDEALVAKFRSAKDAEYAELSHAAHALAKPKSRRKRELSEEERGSLRAEIERLERRAQELSATDFFAAQGGQILASALRELRRKTEPLAPRDPKKPNTAHLRGRTWVTRAGVHVDRIASAWLIRHFIDPEAVLKFVPAKGYVPAKAELRFDMFEAEFSHEGDHCTFETLCQRFAVNDPGVRELGEVVHDINLKENKFAHAETAGIAACIAGICRMTKDDEERIAQGCSLLDGLLAHFASKTKTTKQRS